MMVVPLSGRQMECCSCRRKACFYNWKKSTQIKEFCSQGRNLQVNKHCDLFPKLCFRQTSALCYVLCVQYSAEWCRHVEQNVGPAAVLWNYQSLIIQTWHVLQKLFISVYSRKFIIGNLHTQHIANTCFIKATLFIRFWKISNVFFSRRNVITFRYLCLSWYKIEFLFRSTYNQIPHYVVFLLRCYLVHLRPKFSPRHHILKHLHPTFLPQFERSSFTPKQNNKQNYSSVYLNL